MVFLVGLLSLTLRAQLTPLERDTAEEELITIEWADVLSYKLLEDSRDTLQRLEGHVELRQDTVLMFCDTALLLNRTYLRAVGNVIIQQGDSLSIFADSLIYRGDEKIADFYGEVVMVNKKQKLFTNHLNYNLETKVGTYRSGATITNDTTFLSSTRGYYFVKTRDIFFRDSVVVIDPEFTLRSDTLKFNTESQLVTFLGPTLIVQDSAKIYCEGGFYDVRRKFAEFHRNAQYVKGPQKATALLIEYDGEKKEIGLLGRARFEEDERVASADIIRYNEETEVTRLRGHARVLDGEQVILADSITHDARQESYATRGRSFISDPPQLLQADRVDFDKEREVGIATGNVIWQDTSEHLTIVCARADYDKSSNFLKASGGRAGRPLLLKKMEDDTLFLVADTLLSFAADTARADSTRILLAFPDVRIFKSDLQGRCDSLSYAQPDSSFTLFFDPVLWSDTSQFSADTIRIQLAQEQIDRIFLFGNAFIINSPDELFFNQIKGKNSIAFFEDGELRRVRVSGNAETVYYPLDDDGAYIGVNKTLCSEMLLFFGDNEVEGIRFFAQPQATLLPMQRADHEQLKLPGFRWRIHLRPQSLEDLFSPTPPPT
ncbi:MAG: hypothetical protein D6765_00760, partial [Bacteroidetes bacterium]